MSTPTPPAAAAPAAPARPQRVDAIVIGAGPNGLVAAIRLARAGRDVLVLEAADHPGGAVTTAELTLPGFRHDVFSSVYPAGAASPVFERLPLSDHGLQWVHPEIPMAHPLPDGSAAALHREIEATVAQLESVSPGDGIRWRDFCQPYLDHLGAVRRTMLGGFPPLGGGLRLVAGFGLQRVLDFARLLLLPASVLAEELFTSELGKALMYGSVLHGDVPPTDAGSGIAGFYLNLLGHAVGWPSPRGGADGLTASLVSYLDSLGGQIRTGARVERVVSRGGRVAGVVVADGSRYRTDVVVADVSPRGLVGLTGEDLPPDYRRRMAAFRYGPLTVKADWALDAPIPWTAPEARRAGTVHVGGAASAVTTTTGDVRAGRIPKQPFLLSGQQSIADPSRAPAGRHTAWAYTRVPRGHDWSVESARHADRMEEQIERFAPGFRSHILARHVLAPGDMQQRNANLIGGDVGGGTYALDQLVFRPIPSLTPYRTPLSGLYIGSASTFPGGAVHGAPGWAAAGQALAFSRLRW